MISIIMPVKNGEEYIEACIRSILRQTIADWELLVVDDHSIDLTASLVKEIIKQDNRIKLFANKGKGILPALITGEKHTKGVYITRMDSDDLMPENKLKTFYELIKNTEGNTLVTGKVQYFSDQKVSPGYLKYQDWLNSVVDKSSFFQEIYRECTIASPNWMVSKNQFMSFGGFGTLNYPEDYDMVFKLKEAGFNVASSSEITHLWREHPTRTSRNSDIYQQQSFFSLKLKYFLKNELKKNANLSLWGAGRKGKLVAKRLIEKKQSFSWFDWQSEKYKAGLYNQLIQPIEDFSKLPQPLVINTVVPSDDEQKQIDLFIAKNQLFLGENYFVF